MKKIALCAVLLALSIDAGAQIQPPAAPVYSASDENGVNLASGSPYFSLWDVAIGSGESSLSHTLYSNATSMGVQTFNDSFHGGMGWKDDVWINQNQNYPTFWVQWDGSTELFYVTSGDLLNGPFVSLNGRGSTLAVNPDGTYTYRKSDGTIFTLGARTCGMCASSVTRVQYPNGRVLTIHRSGGLKTAVTSNDGLQIKYNYSGTTLTSVVAINNAYEYCDPTALTCSLTQVWPTATYTSTGTSPAITFTVTDALGRVTRYTNDSANRVTGIKLPTSASADNITYSYCNNSCFVIGPGGTGGATFYDMVTAVQKDGQVWNYSFLGGSGFSFSQFTSTNPQGLSTTASLVATFAPQTPFVEPILSIGGPNGGAGWDITDPSGRPTGVSFVNGQSQTPTYDARGNVASMSFNPRNGPGDSPRIVNAGYDATCTNPITCNRANYVIDPRGKQTDFEYDPVHGGVLSVTGPADANGIRPKTRYSYAQRYAWIKNSSGSYVQAATPIWVRTQERYCRTSNAVVGGSCTAAGDEVVIAYDYGPNSGPNNLFVRGIATTADGVTLRACYGRDPRGNMISETKPRAGLASCP